MPIIKHLCVLLLLLFASPCFAGTYTIELDDPTFDGDTDCAGVCDGDDIIQLAEGSRTLSLSIVDVHGSAGNLVTIENASGVASLTATASTCVQILRSTYFELSGGSTDGVYGIKLTGGSNTGLFIYSSSDNYLIHNLEITGSAIGMQCKELTTAGFNVDVEARFNYMHDITNEAFYFGDSSYTVGEPTIQGSIHDNRIEDIGYDGIQVGAAINGFEIYNNSVKRVGLVQTGQPANTMTGIVINEGTLANVHDNWIEDFYKWGVYYIGKTGGNITDNIILGGTTTHSIEVQDPNIETTGNIIIDSFAESVHYGAWITTGSIHGNYTGNSGSTAIVAAGLAVPGEVYDNVDEANPADLAPVVSWTANGDYSDDCISLPENTVSSATVSRG